MQQFAPQEGVSIATQDYLCKTYSDPYSILFNVWDILRIFNHLSPFFPNSDSLGLLTLKVDGRRRVYGCRPGRCLGGVGSRVSRWCLIGVLAVLVVSRWCMWCLVVSCGVRAVSVMSWWCLGVSRWCPGGVLVYLGGVLVVSRRCLGGGLGGVSVASRWCLGGVSVASAVSRWYLGGVWWCLGCVSAVLGWCLGGVSVSRWGLGRFGAVFVFRWRVDDVSVVSLVLVVSWWCLSGVHVDSRCSRCLGRILVASCWWCGGSCVGPLVVLCTR